MAAKLAVVIPVYRQDHHLETTLLNVRDAVQGLEEVRVVLLNNRREVGVLQQLIERHDLPFDYIENEATLPISQNWNKCIEVADAPWVHILHEDDTVEMGFYQRFLRAIDSGEDFQAFVARHYYIDGVGLKIGVGLLVQSEAGVFSNMAHWQAYRNVIQPPCIIVQREVYERIGNFRADLRYTLDWEMWYRICHYCKVWYEPETLVNYRVHDTQLTTDEKDSGNSAYDVIKGAEVLAEYCDAAHIALVKDHACNHILATAKQYFRQRKLDCAKRQLMILVAWNPRYLLRKEVRQLIGWYIKGWAKQVVRSPVPQNMRA